MLISLAICDDYKPEEVGLSSKRLKLIDNLIDTCIKEKKMAGAVVLIARKGEIAYFRAAGRADIDKPMKKEEFILKLSLDHWQGI